jgi:hypothetical protein
MANERYDYIVLDGLDGSWDGSRWKQWEVPNHFFAQYEKNDDIFIELHSCDFSGKITDDKKYASNGTVNMDGVNIDNQQNTYGEKILSVVHGEIVVDESDNYLSPVETYSMKLKVNKFNNIKLCVEYQNKFLDIESSTDCKFVLKVSYKSIE